MTVRKLIERLLQFNLNAEACLSMNREIIAPLDWITFEGQNMEACRRVLMYADPTKAERRDGDAF